ncbi:MAG TPA: hypothetical protein PLH65_02515, partial [bacterium]|nr:hypothetical protein [bacterium]
MINNYGRCLIKTAWALSMIAWTMSGVGLNVLQAADYASNWKSQSEYLNLTAGQVGEVWVEFENTGSANWYKDGDNAIHLGTANKLDRASQFFVQDSWLTDNRIEMQQDVVQPGQVGKFVFKVKAPSQSGVYREYFRPVVENVAWLNDQGVYWEFRVSGSVDFEDMCMSRDDLVTNDNCVLPEAWMYSSKWKAQSDYIQLKPGETKDVWVEFENTGQATWYQNGDYAVRLGTSNPIDRTSLFVGDDWINDHRLKMVQANVQTGEVAKFSFQIKAPNEVGTYKEYFRPVAENVAWLNDDGVFWQVEVVDNDSNDSDSDNGNVPEINSGAAKVSSDGTFDIYNAYTNQLIETVDSGNQVALYYDGKYQVWADGKYFEVPDYVQLRAKDGAILRVDS